MNRLIIVMIFVVVVLATYMLMRGDKLEPEITEVAEYQQQDNESSFEAMDIDESESFEAKPEYNESVEEDQPTENYASLDESYDDYAEQDMAVENEPTPMPIEDVTLEDTVSESVEEKKLTTDELLLSEAVDQEWASDIEDRISTIFTDSDNYVLLSESGLDFSDSECRTTVCQINFIPNIELDKSIKMKQMLSLTSFLGQDNTFSTAQLDTKYTEEGFLSVTLQFRR